MQKLKLAVLLCVLFSLTTVAFFFWLHGTNHRDFFPCWAAARLYHSNSVDKLYSPETTQSIQLTLYGEIIPPNLDQQACVYPAHFLTVLSPLYLIPNREIATALWQSLSLFSIVLSLYLLNKRSVFLVFCAYPTIMIFNAQFEAVTLLALTCAYLAYQYDFDFLAGVTLAFTTFKPQLAILPLLVILCSAAKARRWRVVQGFTLSSSLLLALSFISFGFWIPDWLYAVFRYSSYGQSAWAPATALNIHPLVLFAALLLCLTRFCSNPDPVLSSVPLSLLSTPQTLPWSLTILLFPLSSSSTPKLALFFFASWLALLSLPWQSQALLFPLLVLLLS